MKVAMKRDVKMEGLAFERETIRSIGIWYHFKSRATRGIFNRGHAVICLKTRHRIESSGGAAPNTHIDPEPDEAEIVAYTDGSAINNGKEDAQAGAGVWYGPDDGRNRAIKVPPELSPSNNVGELLAIKDVVEKNPRDIPLTIISDSKISLDGLTKNLEKWEENGFTTVKNGPLFQVTVARLRERTAPTTFKKVKGHSGVEGNEEADKLAAEGCAKPEATEIVDMHTNNAYLLPGAKLETMTQSTAYKIIRKEVMDGPGYQAALDRYTTSRNMIYAQDAASDLKGETPSPRQIWKSTRHKDFSKSVRFFIWMLIHDGYKVGRYWRNITGHEWKGICDHCGAEESMNHILTECQEHGQKQVWDLASELWEMKTKKPLRPLIGEIMACGVIKRGLKPNSVDKGTSRLFRILVSESAFLIWRLRNERRIQGKDAASEREIRMRWKRTINIRLGVDCLRSNEKKYAKKATPKSLVLKTWTGVLLNEDTLPADWSRETQVLVGIG
ncbi:ribonuclease H-like protein [Mycena crocata]|nr:ribonuclease H-like protein [Mycena crocata]